MTCKKLKLATRAEQDYWLSFSDYEDVTEEERLDFLRYDSHGRTLPERGRFNPILLGKIRHGQSGEVLRDSYFDTHGGWIGGLLLVIDFLEREPFQIRPLVEWFGHESVKRWLGAFDVQTFPQH